MMHEHDKLGDDCANENINLQLVELIFGTKLLSCHVTVDPSREWSFTIKRQNPDI